MKEEIIKRATEETPQEEREVVEIAQEIVADDDDVEVAPNYSPDFKPGEIANRSIVDEMRSDFIDYSMSVIVARALPEVKDGLKPSQRRILVAMNDANLIPSSHYSKSAKVAGATSGNYHPHGEVVIYPTMVKMAQDFSTRYPLIDGQGNFGCFTKDTKVRLTDGRNVSFGELVKEDKKGKKNYTFTVNKNGSVSIALIKKPRLTIKKAKIMHVVLDNSEEIRCTLNHRFLLKNGKYVEAQNLVKGDSLMPIYNENIFLVVNIIFKEEFEDVYDLTIDNTHNFALSAGVFVHNSVDGDPAAAMRYTEVKMSKITVELLKDLEKGTVTYVPNYDGTKLEPTVLPAAIPQLLVNGCDGIAVGMATKIPPHNITELITALREMIKKGNSWEGNAIYNDLRIQREKSEKTPMTLDPRPIEYLDNYVHKDTTEYKTSIENIKTQLAKGNVLYPEFRTELTPEDLMEYIPGPDFPTGSTIFDKKEILNAYATGRGRILQRAKASIEENKKGRYEIIVTEIPYQVNKSYLQEKIADLVKEKKIEGIADIRDESNIEGMRVVIVLKKDAQPKAVLNKLYKYTQMQTTFSANMISLVEQEPKTLTLKQMLEYFLSFRISVVIRRYEFDLAQARYRSHILEGLLKALDLLDEVIATIRKSKTQEDAKENLISKFDFTAVQAQAILEMQLRKLAALEREKLQEEFNQTQKDIAEYTSILADVNKVLEVIDTEFEEIIKKHGDSRRTKVVKGKVDEISEEDMVAAEDTLVTISHEGYIKRVNPSVYKLQNRGGKGVVGATTKQDDWVEHALLCNTHDDLMIFSNQGRVFKIRVFEVPEYGRTAKGLPLVNLIQLQPEEMATSLLTMSKEGRIADRDIDNENVQREYKFLFMATRRGTVKKTDISEFDKIRNSGLIAAKLEDGDQLMWVKPTTGEDDILLASKTGKCIRFAEEDVRPTGRNTMGVRGIKLGKEGDELISMDVVIHNEAYVLSISQRGFGKMTKLDQYTPQGRGGQGVYTFRVTDKTGKLMVTKIITNLETEIVVISEGGQVIKTNLKNIPVLIQRQTSGVKIMSMHEGDNVAALATL